MATLQHSNTPSHMTTVRRSNTNEAHERNAARMDASQTSTDELHTSNKTLAMRFRINNTFAVKKSHTQFIHSLVRHPDLMRNLLDILVLLSCLLLFFPSTSSIGCSPGSSLPASSPCASSSSSSGSVTSSSSDSDELLYQEGNEIGMFLDKILETSIFR